MRPPKLIFVKELPPPGSTNTQPKSELHAWLLALRKHRGRWAVRRYKTAASAGASLYSLRTTHPGWVKGYELATRGNMLFARFKGNGHSKGAA